MADQRSSGPAHAAVDLTTTFTGITFPNPVLPAAGPNVRDAALMCAAADGGAGGIVGKTVSTVPATDRRPTVRRILGGTGLTNAETWSEIAVEEYISHLLTVKERGLPLVVSVGYRPEEVRTLGKLLEREVAPDAIEFSTHYTGSSIEPLVDVAKALRDAVTVPVWMKLSPTVPDIAALATKAADEVDAFVAVNSYGPVLDFDPENPVPRLGTPDGTGWLSGPPLRPIALRIVNLLRQVQSKPIVGVGGISTGRDAVLFLMAGASLVQVCSAAIARGNGVYGEIAGDLAGWLGDHGYTSPTDIVGRYRPETDRYESAPADRFMTVDPAMCTGCRACLDQCVHGAITLRERKATIDQGRCIGCGYCEDVCRYGAMKLQEVHG